MQRQDALEHFSRNLRHLLADKGWNNSELARRAEQYMPPGRRFGRDTIGTYCKGRNLPDALHLDALAKALSVEPSDLLPTSHAAILPAPPRDEDFSINDAGGGKARLRVNTTIDWPTAIKIMEMLKGSPI